MTRIGCTGHQTLTAATRRNVVHAIASEITRRWRDELIGLCCLAEGADQLFALTILASGGRMHVVIPSNEYESTFHTKQSRENYKALLNIASDVSTLSFSAPSEDAFMAAGQEIVDQCDVLLAVWDGKPAGGKGGTADVVAYARRMGVEVRIIWPPDSQRE
ncbi:hypothetical protein [Streptomyces sp. NPDC088350]|uniref:hypothetical protein n=1 Tax=Streptomyces sp. NPDC088350 TaxID=3365854 RepID=UPI00381076A1